MSKGTCWEVPEPGLKHTIPSSKAPAFPQPLHGRHYFLLLFLEMLIRISRTGLGWEGLCLTCYLNHSKCREPAKPQHKWPGFKQVSRAVVPSH